MGDELGLPEPIIQVIQSFLTARKSAKTTILSKEWRSAWLTRPNLDFDQTKIEPQPPHFCRAPWRTRPKKLTKKIFSEFADKTLKRYEDSNLKIDTFRLCLKAVGRDSDPNSNPAPWIVKALQLGATRLTLRLNHDDLPNEVFGFENLVAVTLECCKILNNRGLIACSMLQSLCLKNVVIYSSHLIFRIISSCPSIRELSLCSVRIVSCHGHADLVVGDGLTTIHDHGLRSLVLDDVSFDTMFLGDDLSSKFPSLKELTLVARGHYSREEAADLNISSPSLERVNFMDSFRKFRSSRVKFDVPSIRKFTFGGSMIPKLSIRSNSRGSWESHVDVSRRKCLSASWFCRLSKFLTKFRRSRISLSVRVLSKTSFDYEAGDIQGLPRLGIENLKIYHEHLPSISCLVLFDGLFRLCRPKLITQYMSTEYSSSRSGLKTNNIGFLGKKLLHVLDVKIPTPNEFMYGLNDVKEARAEIFDEVVSAWKEVPLDALLLLLSSSNDSTTRENKNRWDVPIDLDALSDDTIPPGSYLGDEDKPKVRFQLIWQP